MLGDLGKLMVAKGFKNLPIVQKIARSGHTAPKPPLLQRRPLLTESKVRSDSRRGPFFRLQKASSVETFFLL